MSLFLCFSVVYAAPTKEWEKTYNHKDSELNVFVDSATNMNNEHYAVGYYRFIADDGWPDYNAMIVKYDKDGNMIWEKDYDDGNYDFENFVGVETLSDGGAVAVGYYDFTKTRSTILSSSQNKFKSKSVLKNNEKVFKEAIGTMMFAIRYDKDGKELWTKEYKLGGLELYSFEEFNNILVDSKDNIYIIPNSGYMDIFKIDKDGNELWTEEISEESTKETNSESIDVFVSPYDIKIDKDDNLLVAIEKETITINYDNGENSDIFEGIFRKYDSDGKLIFEKSERVDNKNTMMVLVDIDKDNNYQVVGYVEDPDNELDSYPIIFTYDKDGNLKDTKNVRSIFEDEFFIADDLFHTDFFIDKTNNYILNYNYKVDKVYAMVDSKRFNNLNKDWTLTSDIKNNLLFKLDVTSNDDYIYVGSNGITEGDSDKFNDFMNATYIENIYNSSAYIVKYSNDYSINKEVTGKGSVDVNLDNAKAGDIITIDTNPDRGYRVDKIIVTDSNGNTIEVKDGKFTMPASDVIVKVIFTNSLLVNPKTGGIDLAGTLILMILLGLAGYEYMKSKQMLSL